MIYVQIEHAITLRYCFHYILPSTNLTIIKLLIGTNSMYKTAWYHSYFKVQNNEGTKWNVLLVTLISNICFFVNTFKINEYTYYFSTQSANNKTKWNSDMQQILFTKIYIKFK